MRPPEFPPEGTPARRIVLRAGHAENLGLLQKFDEARKNYLELVQDVPDFPNIHYAYGRFLLELHETDQAILQFEAEIKNNPNHSLAMLRIASVKYRSDSAAGVAFAEEAVRRNPRLAFGHYLLGLLLADTQNFQRAIVEMEIARKTFVNDPAVYFVLGNAYARTGRKQQAAKARATFKRLNEVGSEGDSGDAGNQRPFRLSPPATGGNGNETKPQ
jgi:tetratricopeptide (TPR) repeat protein